MGNDNEGWNDNASESESHESESEQVVMFVLADNPGLLVSVDDEDNAAGHAVLVSDSGTKVTFTVFNVGTKAGSCTVDLEVDNTWIKSWTSQELPPNYSESAEVKGLGRYPKGYHEFLAYVNPGAGHHDHLTNNVDVLDP